MSTAGSIAVAAIYARSLLGLLSLCLLLLSRVVLRLTGQSRLSLGRTAKLRLSLCKLTRLYLHLGEPLQELLLLLAKSFVLSLQSELLVHELVVVAACGECGQVRLRARLEARRHTAANLLLGCLLLLLELLCLCGDESLHLEVLLSLWVAVCKHLLLLLLLQLKHGELCLERVQPTEGSECRVAGE